tara:strand:+ start:3740 stop:4912 length:1173 start_codon:yes stop_codon:yes gene_type:complete
MLEEEKGEIVSDNSESLKVKKKPKKLATKQKKITKVDLSKKEDTKEDAIQEPTAEKVDVQELPADGEKVGETHIEEEKVTEEGKKEEISVIQEITGEEVSETTPTENIKEEIKETPQLNLPENIEKLVDFMNNTGGTVEDYVRLNADYTNINDEALLKEYYKNTKPHLNNEEIGFIMEDNFLFDEDYDDEKTIRKKKLAYKEEIAKAKGFLEDLKGKYYDEIKLRPGVTQEQQKAMDFYNRYNEEQERTKQRRGDFKAKTEHFFSSEFKGFDFNLGEKSFRYGVQNPSEVANVQSDINNFVKKFLNEEGNVVDHQGYHKALYAARNADTIAKHFYEQGKADATKDIAAKSKNISNEPRTTSAGDVYINGLRVKAISGVDSSNLKLKVKKK